MVTFIKKKKSFNIFYMILLIIATFTMAIGYATINSVVLDIDGTVSSKKQTGVFITDVAYLSNVNAILENSDIINAYQTMLSSNIALSTTDPLSSITYSITVYNSSDEVYYFRGVDYLNDQSTYSNSGIVFSLNGLNIGDSLNGKSYLTFTITFSYKDNLVQSSNKLTSYLTFSFKRKYSVQYDNLVYASNYPSEIYEGETLSVNLAMDSPYNVNVYSNGVILSDYTYVDKVLTVPNVTSPLIIHAIEESNFDIPVTDDKTNFIIVDSAATGTTINVKELFDMNFSGINGSSRIITAVELDVVYTSTTGSKQQIISILTHNGVEHKQTLYFDGKVNNALLTIRFENLSIGIYDTFSISNTNSKLTNGSISIISEELKIFYNE